MSETCMTLGEDVVVVQEGWAIYAKLTSRALYALQCRKLIDEFNEGVGSGTVKKMIKRANRFLHKHKLDSLVALNEDDLKQMAQGDGAPAGSLLIKFPPA